MTHSPVLYQSPNQWYSKYRNYAPPLDVKGGIITEKVFPVFVLDLFWLGHVHLGVNGCHRKVGTSNVKK